MFEDEILVSINDPPRLHFGEGFSVEVRDELVVDAISSFAHLTGHEAPRECRGDRRRKVLHRLHQLPQIRTRREMRNRIAHERGVVEHEDRIGDEPLGRSGTSVTPFESYNKALKPNFLTSFSQSTCSHLYLCL